ncbi:putative teichuronic acid biosynthesis glycosyl transferase TuaC [Dehalobacter sp. UNSWDHB]|uniref:glycosyltransferase family 4 protein n=1 Tax=Dehalobacter sp. UNSWDHB TaxID=1339256 RepID=UPI0003877A24|nr:glycosyltransferase [Dehalobacter sp. UNSWDHB]EQB20258.1 putative teichuronic acid biosynthesis glycosyl transferase TuaC [Dehalobacter sp. UNSWDHB]
MKILVISHMYPSSQNPAYGIFIHKQVKALQDQGCEIKVVSPVPYAPWPLPALQPKWRAYASIPDHDVVDGVEVYYPRYLEFPRSYFLEQSGYFMYRGIRRQIAQIRRDFPFELIHAHVALPDGHAAFLLKKDDDVPLVVTIHGQDFQSTMSKNEKCRRRLFEVLEGTDRIITVSSKLKNIIRDQAFFSKTEVINNGINLNDCVPPPDISPSRHSNRHGISADIVSTDCSKSILSTDSSGISDNTRKEIRILSVSNLKKTKGIDLNLRAVSSLAGKYPSLKYFIAGDGEERQALEDLTESLNLKDKVIFLGKLTHPEVMKEMAEADIFSLPSWQEGFGVVYIEAMAQGLPVIGVRGEGIEDALIHGQNGLLAAPRNVEDLTGALDSLLRDPVYCRRLGEAGRQTVLDRFTWSNNAARTAGVYQTLTGGRKV